MSGMQLLERLNIDGFMRAEPALFDGIRALVRAVDRPGA